MSQVRDGFLKPSPAPLGGQPRRDHGDLTALDSVLRDLKAEQSNLLAFHSYAEKLLYRTEQVEKTLEAIARQEAVGVQEAQRNLEAQLENLQVVLKNALSDENRYKAKIEMLNQEHASKVLAAQQEIKKRNEAIASRDFVIKKQREELAQAEVRHGEVVKELTMKLKSAELIMNNNSLAIAARDEKIQGFIDARYARENQLAIFEKSYQERLKEEQNGREGLKEEIKKLIQEVALRDMTISDLRSKSEQAISDLRARSEQAISAERQLRIQAREAIARLEERFQNIKEQKESLEKQLVQSEEQKLVAEKLRRQVGELAEVSEKYQRQLTDSNNRAKRLEEMMRQQDMDLENLRRINTLLQSRLEPGSNVSPIRPDSLALIRTKTETTQ